MVHRVGAGRRQAAVDPQGQGRAERHAATAAQAGDIHGNPAMGVRFVSSNAQPNRKRRALTVEDVDAILSKL